MTQTADIPSRPIACTLGAGDYAERLAWIAALNRDALRAHRRDGLALDLTYAWSAEDRVRELVRRERACCAFLDFSIDVTTDAVRLRVTAPADAAGSADVLLEPFLGGTPDALLVGPDARASGACAPGCGCAATDTPTTTTADAPVTTDTGRRVPSLAAASTAVAALACGVCCALPFALPAAALATFGGVIAAAARVYWWALGAAVVAVVAAWLLVAWQSVRSRRRPARSTVVAMGTATVVLLAALGWSYVEPRVIAWLHA